MDDKLLLEAAKKYPVGTIYKSVGSLGSTYTVQDWFKPYWWGSGMIALADGKGLVYRDGEWAKIIKLGKNPKKLATSSTYRNHLKDLNDEIVILKYNNTILKHQIEGTPNYNNIIVYDVKDLGLIYKHPELDGPYRIRIDKLVEKVWNLRTYNAELNERRYRFTGRS